MTKRRLLPALMLAILLGLSWAGCKTTRAGVESPDYEVMRRAGPVEVRRYPAMTGVATATGGEGEQGRNSGFGRLFRYISGENEREEKIAMTSPVLVETDGTARETRMVFLMPAKVAGKGAPSPRAETVQLQTYAGGEFAALRFKGYRSAEARETALADLKRHLEEAGLAILGEPFFAYYDPPWIPEALRRNEVLARVSRDAGGR